MPGALESIEPVGLEAVLAEKRGAGWSEDRLASYERGGGQLGARRLLRMVFRRFVFHI